MNDVFLEIAFYLLRASILVGIAAFAAFGFMKLVKTRPSTQATIWLLVLLPGCLLTTFTIELPVLESTTATVTPLVFPDVTSHAFPSSQEPIDTANVRAQLPLLEFLITSSVLAWLVGITCFTFHYYRLYRTASLMLSRCLESDNRLWTAELDSVVTRCELRKRPLLLVSPSFGPALSFRVAQPAIVVPSKFWRQCGSIERTTILQHEIAHLTRHDPRWSIIARTLFVLQWFNPAAWYAIRSFDEATELACDDQVIGHFKTSPINYAKALVSLVEFRQTQIDIPLALTADGPPIQTRIKRIVQPKGFEMKLSRTLTATIFLCVALCQLLRFELVAQEGDFNAVASKLKLDTIQQNVDSNMTSTLNTTDNKDQVNEKRETRTYYIGDLVIPFSSKRVPKQSSEGIRALDFVAIEQCIKSTIQPDSWLNGSTLQSFPPNQNMIVSCTNTCHKEIRQLLKKLRALTSVSTQFHMKIFVIPRDEKFNLRLSNQDRTGRKQLNKFYERIGKVCTVSFDVPNQTVFNGQEIDLAIPAVDSWQLNRFQFVSTHEANRPPQKINCAALIRARDSKIKHAEKLLFYPIDYSKPATSMDLQTVTNGGFQLFDISKALKNENASHKAILVVYAAITDRRLEEHRALLSPANDDKQRILSRNNIKWPKPFVRH